MRLRNWTTLCILAIIVLDGCGGSSTTPPPPPPPLATSRIGPGGTELFASITVAKSTLNGVNPSTLGLNVAWTLTSGSALMNFTATPTASWLTISPTSGTLEPGGSTAIGLLSLDATSLPNARNTGGFTVSAPNYQDNTLIGVEVNCSFTDLHGNPLCQVAVTGDPATHPLP